MKTAFLLAATSASLLVASAAHAQFAWSNFYGTGSVSYVDLQREAPADPLITRDSKNDAGVGLGIGYQFHPKLAIEVSRHDLGTSRLTDAGAGGPNYSDQSARATVVAVKYTPWTEWTFQPFAKVGNARVRVALDDTAGVALRIARDQTYFAIGVDYRVMPKVKVGLMYEQYGRTADVAAPAGEPPRLNPRGLALTSSISF
jgi:opacity protein-like surface antigen